MMEEFKTHMTEMPEYLNKHVRVIWIRLTIMAATQG